jgi:hypothetical protein
VVNDEIDWKDDAKTLPQQLDGEIVGDSQTTHSSSETRRQAGQGGYARGAECGHLCAQDWLSVGSSAT